VRDENLIVSRGERLDTLLRIDLWIVLQKSTKGSVVLDHVFRHINLVEIDYFGLRYCDRSHQTVSTMSSREIVWL
jgi:hypothetical protein